MTSPVQPEYQNPHPLSMDRGRGPAAWFQRNARAVGVAGAAVAFAAVASVAWRASERSKAQRAEAALYQAQAAAQAAGDPRQAEKPLRDVATRYRGTPAGAQAELLLAQSLYDAGRFQDGLAVLGRAKPPAQFADAVRLLTAAGYEGSGRAAEAGRLYEELARDERRPARRRAELRAAAGRAYLLANDRASAVRVWREVAASGVGSLSEEARLRLGELVGATGVS